jgi:hypothetical protein
LFIIFSTKCVFTPFVSHVYDTLITFFALPSEKTDIDFTASQPITLLVEVLKLKELKEIWMDKTEYMNQNEHFTKRAK